MRIVQTFWSGGKSLLQDGFGWLHPEYNLKSWALSCLSLREHYDEVALYTDSEGKRILIAVFSKKIEITKVKESLFNLLQTGIEAYTY